MENEEKLEKPDNPLRKEGAKVYLVSEGLIARVIEINKNEVQVKGGSKEYPRELTFSEYEFDEKCRLQEIVAQSQAQFNDNGEYTGIKGQPKKQKKSVQLVKKPKKENKNAINPDSLNKFEPEIGWINEKTGKFSKEKKRGYTQIKFERIKKKVSLELDDSQLQKLKELGIIKE